MAMLVSAAQLHHREMNALTMSHASSATAIRLSSPKIATRRELDTSRTPHVATT